MTIHKEHFAKTGLHRAIEFNPNSGKWVWMVWSVDGTHVEIIDFGREDESETAQRCVYNATK